MNDQDAKPFAQPSEILEGAISFWDLTSAPAMNDRLAKLGRGRGTTGVAALEWDADSLSYRSADGLLRGRVNSNVIVEPDNWVLRPRPNGDTTWDVRLICDHENRHATRAHRNTYVINQCPDQCQGELADALWVKLVPPVGAEIFDREIFFNGAGYLEDLFLGPSDTPTPGGVRRYRAAVMFNISQQGGYATDGRLAGQMRQVFTLARARAGASAPTPGQSGGPNPTLGGGFAPITPDPRLPASYGSAGTRAAPRAGEASGPTQAEPGGEQTAGGADCCSTEAGTVAIRHDAPFSLPEGLARLDINSTEYEETHGDIFVGGFWPARRRGAGSGNTGRGFANTGNPTVRPGGAMTQNPGTPAGGSGGGAAQVADDPSSNQPPLPDVENERWIRPWIRVEPRFELVHEAAPFGGGSGPTGAPPGSGSPPPPTYAQAPVTGVIGLSWAHDVEMGFVHTQDLPDKIAAGKSLDVVVNFEVPDFSGDLARFDLRYSVCPKGGTFGTPGTVTKHFNNDTYASGTVGRVVFRIPSGAFAGAGGGKVHWDLMRRADHADDTYGDRIYTLAIATHWGDRLA